jgi:hypothetical protein
MAHWPQNTTRNGGGSDVREPRDCRQSRMTILDGEPLPWLRSVSQRW